MKLVLIGPPGSGKGTVSQFLHEKYGISALSTGNILRAEIKAGSSLGLLAKSLIDEGNFVPDEVVAEIVQNALQSFTNGYVLDGFPRNLYQAEILDKLLKKNKQKLDRVLFLHAPASILKERILNRLVCTECGASYNRISNPPKTNGVCDLCKGVLEVRKDDRTEYFLKRLQIYEEETAPVLPFYEKQQLTVSIDATQALPIIFSEISKIFEKNK